jgi:Restriction endonuclease
VLKAGEPILVGEHDVRYVEAFDPTWSRNAAYGSVGAREHRKQMSPIRLDEPEWRQYERQIHERLLGVAGRDAEVQFDQMLRGKHSGADRQVDVLVTADFPGFGHARMAVDCKYFSSKINLTGADRFVGYIDDLPVDLGLLVTTQGFTEAAKRRVQSAGRLRWDIVPFDELEDWEPPLAFCQVCREARHPDSPPGVVWMEPFAPTMTPPGGEFARAAGACEYCGSVHVECQCGAVRGVYEAEEGEWLECYGGCGMEFRVVNEYDRKGIPLTTNPHEMVEFRMSPAG